MVKKYILSIDSETKEYFDITCPHGVVTYRLSRIKENDAAE